MVRVVYMGTLDCCRSSPTQHGAELGPGEHIVGAEGAVTVAGHRTHQPQHVHVDGSAVVVDVGKGAAGAAAGRARERSAAAVSSAARIRFNFILISPVFL